MLSFIFGTITKSAIARRYYVWPRKWLASAMRKSQRKNLHSCYLSRLYLDKMLRQNSGTKVSFILDKSV